VRRPGAGFSPPERVPNARLPTTRIIRIIERKSRIYVEQV
jgi:hypothetical protein